MSTESELVKRFLLERGPECVHNPSGKLRFQFVTPTHGIRAGADDASDLPERSSVGHYLQMYDWDACFFSQAAGRLGLQGLGLDIVQNFLGLVEEGGYTPRTVSSERVWDKGDQCKPFLAQLLLSEWREGRVAVPLEPLVRKLEKYLSYFREHRRDKIGLYHWRNVLESGVDNNLALLYPTEAAKDENFNIGDFPDSRIIAVDLNSYLACEFGAFSELAKAAGAADLADFYRHESDSVKEKIEDLLWDQRSEIYLNWDPVTDTKVPIKAWTSMTPVFFGLARKARAETIIEKYLMNEREFLRPFGISSLSSSEPLYNQAKRGLYGRVIVSQWQGPMWILPNAMASRALLAHGMVEKARGIAHRVIVALAGDLRNSGTLHENYDAETGQPLWAPKFMSWNILALALIDLLA